MWYASNCSGTISRMGDSTSGAAGIYNDMIRRFRDLFIAFGGQRDHHPERAFTSFMLEIRLFVAQHRVGIRSTIARRDHHHRQVLVDQRVGTVLHLAGGISLGVDVGDLLQLERAFERDRDSGCRAPGTGSPAPAGRACASSSQTRRATERSRACRECGVSSCISAREPARDPARRAPAPDTWPR